MEKKGNIISVLRREAGYTQKTLANALNITDKAVSKWERGLCMPDCALLPKLSLLLDADIEFLLQNDNNTDKDVWNAFLDLGEWDGDLGQMVYNKPLVYYLLSHFLLLDVKEIYIKVTSKNRKFLLNPLFEEFGFHFIFDFSELPPRKMIVLNKPLFLFGSDLTRQFQGAMVSNNLIKLAPVNQSESFLFCPKEYSFMCLKNLKYIYNTAIEKSLGRGMVSIEMNEIEGIAEAANFVRMYENNSGLLIGCLEEIAYRKKKISIERMFELVAGKHYSNMLKVLYGQNKP